MGPTGEPHQPAPVRADEPTDRSGRSWSATTRDRLWLAAVVAISAALTIAGTRLEPGLTPDSTNFLSAAHNLADSGRLVMFSGRPLTIFPPGFPTLIAIGEWLGLTGVQAARAILVLSMALTVVLAHVLLRHHVRSAFVLWGATVWVAVSPVLLGVAWMVWSEATFIVVALALLILLERIDVERPSWWIVGAAAALCSAAFLLRYAGLALVPVAALAMLWGWRARLRAAILPLISFAVLASIVPLAWTARNRDADGFSFGGRAPSTLRALDVAADLKQAAVPWLVSFGPDRTRTAIAVLVVVGVLSVIAWMTWKRELTGRDPVAGDASLAPILIFGALYVVYLFAAQLRYRLDPIDDRLLSPVYVPMVVLVAIAVERALHAPALRGRHLRIIAVVIVSLYVAVQVAPTVADTRDAYADGLGFRAIVPRSSELGLAVRDLPAGAIVVTNAPNIWLFWTAARRSPLRAYGSPDLDSLAVDVGCAGDPTYLAWFGPADAQPASSDLVGLTPISDHGEGILYLVTAELDPSACAST